MVSSTPSPVLSFFKLDLMWQMAQVAIGTSAFGIFSRSICVMLMWHVVQPMSWLPDSWRNLIERRLGQSFGHVLNHWTALGESTPGSAASNAAARFTFV